MASGLVDETAYARRDFQEIFGRAPTTTELAQIVPTYVGVDQNLPNQAGGKAFIAQMFESQKNTPDKLYAQQQEEYLKNAPKHFDSINQLFQSTLGRAASQDELNHFGKSLASGTSDSYQLGEFLKQQPEYVSRQNEEMRKGIGTTMAANDKRQFSEQILPSIQEAYAKQGRSFDSSGFQNAAALAAQAQNTNREAFLGNLTASQYGGVQDRAYQDYANQVANQNALTNSGINAQYQGILSNRQRSNEIQDFNTQAQVYNDYLAKYGKRSSGMGGGIGTLAGAGIGALVAGLSSGGLGAGAGAQLGATIGGAGGRTYDSYGGIA